MADKEWKKYEWLFTNMYYDNLQSDVIDVTYNIKIPGHISSQLRQVGILITEKSDLSNNRITAIDCKYYKTKVDIKAAEEFLGICEDIKADFGIMISALGFTRGANPVKR